MRNQRKDPVDPIETPVRDVKIAKMRAAGVTYEKIGKEVGVGTSRVAVICGREDVKGIIESEQKRLVSLVPTAIDNYKHWIGKGQITSNKDEREVAYKASTKVLESTGILNGAPSTLINVLYNDNKTIISPVIMTLLKEFTGKMSSFDDEDIVDGEVIEDEETEIETGEDSME